MCTRHFIASIAFLMIMTGCTKDFDLDPDAVKPLYVIDGRISNMWGPYHVRVTKSTGLVPIPSYFNVPDSAEPVKDALVIITDDTGITDTLIPSPPTIDRYVYFFADTIYYRDITIDSVYTTVSDLLTTHDRGYYQTTKIKGLPGHTYHLRVEIGNEIFEASAYMPPVPVLEHTEYRDTTLSPFLNSGYTPVAYFRDPPNEKNYYMLISNYFIHGYRYDSYFRPGQITGSTVHTLQYFLFDDKLLTPDLNAVPVRHMLNYSQHEPYYSYWIVPPFPTQVRLQSLTKETYDYFDILGKQIYNDGNVYKPAPSSAPGNISGGALGFFYASHISDRLVYPR